MVSSNFIQCPRCGKLHNHAEESKLCSDCIKIVNENMSNNANLFESTNYNDDGFFDVKNV